MRVLVTGAAGLCGTHLVQRLISEPEVSMVYGVDNFTRGHPLAEKYVVPDTWRDKYQLLFKRYQDLTIKEINNLDLDVVIHAAAYNSSQESMNTPGEYFSNNDHGTLLFLEKLLQTKNKPFFIFLSTAEVYGNPQVECVSEETNLTPLNFFAATKVCGENYCSVFSNWHNYPLAIIRLSKVYGEEQSPLGYTSVIGNFINKALSDEPLVVYGNGLQRRDFIYAGDVGTAIVCIVKACQKTVSGTFNVGSGHLTTIEELAGSIIRIIGSKSEVIKLPPIREDIHGFTLDVTKIEKLIGWRPKVDLDDGLRRTIRWQKEHKLAW